MWALAFLLPPAGISWDGIFGRKSLSNFRTLAKKDEIGRRNFFLLLLSFFSADKAKARLLGKEKIAFHSFILFMCVHFGLRAGETRLICCLRKLSVASKKDGGGWFCAAEEDEMSGKREKKERGFFLGNFITHWAQFLSFFLSSTHTRSSSSSTCM